jgi:hypothetical protein
MTVETEAFADPAFDTVIVGSITKFEMPRSDANLIAVRARSCQSLEADSLNLRWRICSR